MTRPVCWEQVTVPSLPCSARDVQGILYHPVLWKVLSGSVHPSKPVSWLLGITLLVLVELVGVGWFVRAWATSVRQLDSFV